MKLAAEFATWAEQLRRFPEDIAFGLCPLLRQLAAAIGAGVRSDAGHGEPDGVSGITQRERFERLLPSQWLLASEVPEEFVRRAAMGELLFLAPARRKRSAAARCVAVLDGGPSQLGAPRLVHMAMLLVLERRALRAGAQLQWLVVQAPELLHVTCEQSDIRALLDARSTREPGPEDVQAILGRIGSLSGGDELIWIGGERMCELAQPERGVRCHLIDPLRPENDQLLLEVQSAHRRREFVLQLPPPALRTRLIRHPFETPEVKHRVISAAADSFQFSPDGRRILVFTEDRVEAHLPNYARGFRPPCFAAAPDMETVGAGWHKKSLLALYAQGGTLVLDWAGKRLSVRPTQKSLALPEGRDHCRLVVMGRTMPRVLIADASGTLFIGRRQGEAPIELRPLLDRVLDLRWRQGLLAYARLSRPGELEIGTLDAEGNVGCSKRYAGVTPPEWISGYDIVRGEGVFAVQTQERGASSRESGMRAGGRWDILRNTAGVQTVELSDSDEAIACLPVDAPLPEGRRERNRGGVSEWCILAYSAVDRRLHAVGASLRRPLCVIPEPASAFHWDECASRLLYLDGAGRILVLNHVSRKPPFVIEPGSGSAA